MAADKNGKKHGKYKLWTLPDEKSVISLLSDEITGGLYGYPKLSDTPLSQEIRRLDKTRRLANPWCSVISIRDLWVSALR